MSGSVCESVKDCEDGLTGFARDVEPENSGWFTSVKRHIPNQAISFPPTYLLYHKVMDTDYNMNLVEMVVQGTMAAVLVGTVYYFKAKKKQIGNQQ